MSRKNVLSLCALTLIGLLAGAPTARAADVTVKGVHLCCGSCVEGATAALSPVKGVTKIACDRDSKLVNFHAADDKAASAGIAALAAHGFHGKATHGGKPLSFPASGVKKGTTADILTLHGLHLCCGGCVDGAQTAVEKVNGVTAIDIDREAGTMKLTGKNIDVVAALMALNDGGFHGTVKAPAKSKK